MQEVLNMVKQKQFLYLKNVDKQPIWPVLAEKVSPNGKGLISILQQNIKKLSSQNLESNDAIKPAEPTVS